MKRACLSSRTIGHAPLLIISLLVLSMAASPCAAGPDDAERWRLLGILQHTPLQAVFSDAPAAEAFDALGDALGVPVIVRFSDERWRSGLDPATRITLNVETAPALAVLEMLIEQCSDLEPATWQLRNGFIEVGTKTRLGVPAAAERRMYPLPDLLIEPPYFQGMGPPVDTGRFWRHEYRTAAISRPARMSASGGGLAARKRSDELREEMIRAVVQMIEPGNWDYRQFDRHGEPLIDLDGTDRFSRPRRRVNADPETLERMRRQRIARVRAIGDRLIIPASRRSSATGVT